MSVTAEMLDGSFEYHPHGHSMEFSKYSYETTVSSLFNLQYAEYYFQSIVEIVLIPLIELL